MSVTVANTDAQLSGKTLVTTDANQTIDGLKTYDRGTSAPFAVVSGAAKVTNLDADKLDGLEGAAYAVLANATAFLSSLTVTTSLGMVSGQKLYLDGIAMTGDTYILESAANVLSLFSGGVEAKLTSGVLTLGVAGTHTITGAANSAQTLALTNTTSGTAGKVEELQTAGTAVGRLSTFSQGFTTSGLSQLSSTLLEAQGAGGLSVAASNAAGTIRFYAKGTTLTGGFVGAGLFHVSASETYPTGSTNAFYVDNVSNVNVAFSHSTTAGQSWCNFLNGNGSIGSISGSGTTTAYNTSSDRRLKDDIGVAVDLSGLRSVEVHDFAWKVDGAKDRGVFAQDAHAVFPRAVNVGTDELDAGGHLKQPWQVDYSKFVADLIVGWQQHDATIQQLAARVAELEARH